MKQQKREVHYTIMGIIGIIFASFGLMILNLKAILLLGLLPMVCIVLFWITKHPAAGIGYTILFLLNRIEVFSAKSTIAAMIIVVALLIYFCYVNYLSVLDWKNKKKIQIEENKE